MTDVVITAAKRTPVGAFLGAFAATPAHELGRVAIVAGVRQLVHEDTDAERTSQTVGEYEADIERGRLNIKSPLARALIGKTGGASGPCST